ncbi:acyltransferase domain-containing protein [Streptomyces sp. NPDC050504]|uniref:acyltransferase domain-containing protein n=1 Tax=Streptomyces sp. NPDC050504 TaxID=3365618 RepID=UPI0037B33821
MSGGAATAVLLPGIGSYVPGALAPVRDHPVVRATLSEIDGAVAGACVVPPPSALLLGDGDGDGFGGSGGVGAEPAGPPWRTDPPRPAEVVFHLAVYAQALSLFRLLLATEHVRPTVVIGHSLGDIAALAAVGTVTAGDGARLLLATAVARSRHRVPPGGLLALRLSAADTVRLLNERPFPGLELACDNAPRQSVVCGPADQLDALGAAAREQAVTATRVATRTLFHSPVLRAVADDVRDVAERVRFAPPRFPVRSSAPVPLPRHAGALRDAVTHHLVRPVRFRQTVRVLALTGVSAVVEAAPRPLLTPLVRTVAPAMTTRAVPVAQALPAVPAVRTADRAPCGAASRERAAARADAH